ncbi:MAG: hypothetical protein BAJALOKI3v1_180004 [Promethearchaeota archaeon]|nr:MAG: hypothetical protein BAJALOKI3v1_180004 [Candidatus Lokiarchaeota archaeon]
MIRKKPPNAMIEMSKNKRYKNNDFLPFFSQKAMSFRAWMKAGKNH